MKADKAPDRQWPGGLPTPADAVFAAITRLLEDGGPAAPAPRRIKAGQVLNWQALLGDAIVERPGQLP